MGTAAGGARRLPGRMDDRLGVEAFLPRAYTVDGRGESWRAPAPSRRPPPKRGTGPPPPPPLPTAPRLSPAPPGTPALREGTGSRRPRLCPADDRLSSARDAICWRRAANRVVPGGYAARYRFSSALLGSG